MNPPLFADLTPGVHKHREADGQVLVYRYTEITRTTVDAGSADLLAEFLNWPKTRPLYMLLNIASDNVMVSAYALHRCRELTRVRPDVCGKVAIVTANVLTRQIVGMALRGLPTEYRRRRLFPAEADAFAWLLQDAKINH